jgi:hypothetical protein
MGKFLQLIGLQESADAKHMAVLEGTVETLEHRLEKQIEESFAQLELARDNAGWLAISAQYSQEFTREGLRTAAEQGRIMGVANPLIKRGREVRHAYIWGQGVDIEAKNQDVNDLVQAYLDDEGNRDAFFGSQARATVEGCLYDEGNFFLAHFTNPLTGRVKVRQLPFDEMTDKVTAPGDKATTHYFLRTWVENELGADGEWHAETKKAYYPALKFQPATKYKAINGIPVMWDAPVMHIQVNSGQGWKWGIGDSYSAIPWALSHKGFLEDWALLMKALAKIAFTTSSKTAGAAQAKRSAIQNMQNMPAGSTVSMTDDQKLEPLSKSGATLDSESSRPLATMAASALGVPVTILLADPGQTGARATAETLDLPTRLIMQARQDLHADKLRDSIGYAIEQAILAPAGPLRKLGKPLRDEDRLTVEWTKPEDRSLDVSFPSLEQADTKVLIDAIVAAEGIPDMPTLPLIRMALQVLKIDNIDELIEEITDENGKLIEKEVSAGDVAVKAFRDGKDPAKALK